MNKLNILKSMRSLLKRKSILLLLCCIKSISSFAYDIEVNGIYYNINNTSLTAEVTKSGYKYSGSVIIPSDIIYNGTTYKVTVIGSQAFRNCTDLSSVSIPATVIEIQDYSFAFCSALTNIVLPSSLITIGEYAFDGCQGLTSITIPNSLKTIGNNAFMQCSGLTNVTIPNSVEIISRGTFYGCRALSSVSIPNSVSTIGDSAFEGCSSLTSITIPNSVISIGKRAFEDCHKIAEIIIPESCNAIGSRAFYNCISLSSVVSKIPNPFDIDGYVFYKISSNAILIVPKGSLSLYKAKTNWVYYFKDVREEAGPISYTLSIIALGNGSVLYDGTTIRSKTSSFTVNEGTNSTITFVPDNGYRIKTVKVNNTDVTSSVSNNSYTINNISKNTNVEVEFEAIPPTTYTLSIKATGNGSASYSGTTVRGKTTKFTVNEGTNATISFTPDNGYRIKSVKVNNTDVTSSVSNNSYTISNISKNTNVEVEFEAIPPTTYTLSIKATGNGSASYNGTAIRSKTTTFTANEGTNVTITFAPDTGYRIKSVKVNNADVTSSVSNNSYTINNISKNTNVEVEFEAIPPTTYTLSIKAIGNGSASYGGTTVRGKTSTFTVNGGTNATISFTPDNGYRIKTVKVNNTTISLSNNQYTVSNISSNTTVEVEFEAIPPTTYSLSIKVTGNGSASYDGTTIRSKTTTFTVNEGTNAKISFTPDNGYRIKTVRVNNADVTSSVSNNSYTINNISKNTNVEVEFEAIPATIYTLSITASGGGSASYDGTSIRSKTSTFTVNEGTNVSITFTPDNGYRIKSVKENNTIVTSYVSSNTYTISNISRNTTVEVEFEEIPATTYSLSIQAIGYGSVSYDGVTVRSNTNTFTVNEGTNATITFTPDYGCQIKSVKENDSDVTVYVYNNAYTIYDISRDTYLEVEFEVIPITTYDLSISASGNGSASYDGTTIRNRTTSFTVNEGTYATINFAPDNGYRIKNVKENYYNVTSQVRNNSYTTYISGNTTIEVEFEAIPPTTYSLSIKATGNGSASYDGTTIRTRTSSFTLNEGSNAMITFTPDNGYRIKSLMVNNADETANISNNTYIISNIVRNTSVEVEFEEEPKAFAVDGVNYAIRSNSEKTVAVSRGIYGVVLEIPEKVTFQKEEWKVTSIESNALSNSPDLCAIIWNPEAAFTENVKNPNLLLYVKSEDYAPTAIKNVVVNGTATSITLTDAASGNNFYCPQEFTAKDISYTHHYTMETGLGESRGWETIALPFDVQKITHQSKGEIVPFANWKSGDSKKPFWLKEFGSRWPDASSIKAYTPYIISMPNHAKYKEEFKLNGYVTFSAENARIGKTENLSTSSYNGRTFVPNFSLLADKTCYALNVNNDYSSSQRDINENEGSIFYIGLRDIHPFEAYMITVSGTRAIAIEDDMTTGIDEIMEMLDEQKDMKVYNLKGQLIKTVEGKTMDEVRKMLPAGVYIVNGQKLIIK